MITNNEQKNTRPLSDQSQKFIEQLLQHELSSSPNSTVIFGDQIECGKIQIIPIGKVSYDLEGNHVGRTNVNGLEFKPVGYIEIKGGKSSFKPIVEPISIIRTVMLINLLVVLIGSLRPRRRSNPTALKPSQCATK